MFEDYRDDWLRLPSNSSRQASDMERADLDKANPAWQPGARVSKCRSSAQVFLLGIAEAPGRLFNRNADPMYQGLADNRWRHRSTDPAGSARSEPSHIALGVWAANVTAADRKCPRAASEQYYSGDQDSNVKMMLGALVTRASGRHVRWTAGSREVRLHSPIEALIASLQGNRKFLLSEGYPSRSIAAFQRR